MLETIVTGQVMFYVIGGVIAAGLAAKLVVTISLKRLVKAAANMGKSNHAFMRLVRAKFEHACMVSDKVQNVRAFVEKYMYECKTLGIKLHTWRNFEKTAVWLCVLAAAAGAALAYYELGMELEVYRYGLIGGAGAMLMILLRVTADEQYQLEAAKNYMVDFLENTYAHRYVKTNQKEIQVTVQKAPEMAEPEEVPDSQEQKEMEMLEKKLESVAAVAANAGIAAAKPDTVPYYEPQIQEIPPVKDPFVQLERVPAEEPVPGREPQPAPMPVQEPQVVSQNEMQKEARIREILEEFLA